MKTNLVALLCGLGALGLLGSNAARVQPYRCDWSVNGIGGGEMSSTAYKCGSSAGQTAVGLATTSGLQVFAGFWLPDYGVGIQEPSDTRVGNVALVTRLERAAPNPARRIVTIRYTLALDQKVSLAVCDLTGRVVRELLGSSVNRGEHTVVWDGCDGSGHLLPAGVYLLRFAAGDYRTTQKLILQR